MEPVEDEEWETYPGDDAPGQEAVKLQLELLRDPVVSHECVQYPKSDVCEKQEGDELPARLGHLLCTSGANPPTGFGHDHAFSRIFRVCACAKKNKKGEMNRVK